VNVMLANNDNGKEIIPVLWDDNYFALLPGEKKELTATYTGEKLKEKNPVIKVAGWNVSTVNVSL